MLFLLLNTVFTFFPSSLLWLYHSFSFSLSLPLLDCFDKDRSCQQKSAINMFYGFKLALTRICIQFHLNKSFIFKTIDFRPFCLNTTKTNKRLIVTALKFISDIIVFAKMSTVSLFVCVCVCVSVSLHFVSFSFAFSLILPFLVSKHLLFIAFNLMATTLNTFKD